MGDFGGDKTIMRMDAPATLREAVRKAVNSFSAQPVEREYKMTIRQGFYVQRALNKVITALAELSAAVDKDY